MRRAGLWVLAVVLASAGGAFLHAGLTAYSEGPLGTFIGLLCLLTAAAIYGHKLRLR